MKVKAAAAADEWMCGFVGSSLRRPSITRGLGTGTAVELPRQRAKGDSFVGFSTARESLYSPNFIELFSFGR